MSFDCMTHILNKLEKNYKQKMDSENKKTWYEVFKDENEIYFRRAIKYSMLNYKFFPNINEFKKALDNVCTQPITETEKKYLFKKQGIHPEWLDKEIKKEPLTDDEIQKLKEEFIWQS